MTMTMTKNDAKNEVAKVEEGQVPTNFDYGEDVGAGFEGTTGEDLSIPFLGILQSNSPQVEDSNPEGSASGMLFNTVTRELVDADSSGQGTGVIFQPCHKEKAFVEWVPRNKGGGFVTLHDPNGQVVKDAIEANDGNRFGKLAVGDNELAETHYVYGLILDELGESVMGFAVMSFTSTKIKPHKDWITAMYTLKGKPPIYANRARIRTVKQKNEHGTFYNFVIDPLKTTWLGSLIDPKTEAHLLVSAKEFIEMVTSGMARAAFETERSTGDTGATGGAADSEEPPF